MRQIGSLTNHQEAQTFADYLLTRGITSKLDQADNGVVIWIHEEDQLQRAREELDAFREAPQSERYREAAASARHLRQEAQRRDEQFRRSMIDMRRRWAAPGGARERPLTVLLIVACVALTLLSGYATVGNPIYQYLAMVRVWVQPDGIALRETTLRAVSEGQVWRLFTPVLLHGNLLHLAFNMIWLYSLGGVLESRKGTWFFGIFVFVTAVVSNVIQFEWSGPAVGMSGVVYALFGYIWMKSKFDPRAGLFIDPNTVFWLGLWFVLCLLNVIPGVANAAHTAGLVAGMVIGLAPIAWQRLTKG